MLSCPPRLSHLPFCLLGPGPFSRSWKLNLAREIFPSLRRYSAEIKGNNATENIPFNEPSPGLARLDPSADDYSRFIFQDKCRTTVYAGSGGDGCVSFAREKYIEEGPPNGGDGGSGGSIYIQAVEGLTSLHKLARRGVIKAGKGRNGQGKSKGGKRGDDVLIQVPVGTVVREINRYDPVAEEESRMLEATTTPDEEDGVPELRPVRRDRWVLYPGSKSSDFLTTTFPKSSPRRPHLAAMEPEAPIYLDLSNHMDRPRLLAAGAVGGFGNPHFVTRSSGRPRFASRGERGKMLELELELKLLADVGLVGKPNAGKSTLLRSLTNSRTRVGNWEFTTLSPNIGTVVLDNHKGRPIVESRQKGRPTNFTIADIPGLVKDAHLDRGLGLGFLRHIERARILAFVVNLDNEDPVQALKNLWHELDAYEKLRSFENGGESNEIIHGLPELDAERLKHRAFASSTAPNHMLLEAVPRSLPPIKLPLIHTKRWFVVATKADLENTKEKFEDLRRYLLDVETGILEHPGGHKNGWTQNVPAIPVSAIRREGVDRIPQLVVDFLDQESN